MRNILEAPFMAEMIRTTTNMYDHGWDERNGGNISLMLDETEAADYLDMGNVLRVIPTGFTAPELDGKCFLFSRSKKSGKSRESRRHDRRSDHGRRNIADRPCVAQTGNGSLIKK